MTGTASPQGIDPREYTLLCYGSAGVVDPAMVRTRTRSS